MSSNDTMALSDEDLQFLQPFLPPQVGGPACALQRSTNAPTEEAASGVKPSLDRPFVTLTYASSLDGMISLAPGVRTTLSGPETKNMTHYLRHHHDAILVGVGTAIADSPSLNCRYPGATLQEQPRPVVVDPRARWKPENTPVMRLAEEDKAKAPWVVSCVQSNEDGVWAKRGGERIMLSGSSHAEISDHDESTSTALVWRDILFALYQRSIRSVMIEGGATVINALLAQPELVDAVIVTIAPTWLGQGGVAVSPAPVEKAGQRVNAASLRETSWRQFGADAVLCGRTIRR